MRGGVGDRDGHLAEASHGAADADDTELRPGLAAFLAPGSLALVGATTRSAPTVAAALRGPARVFGVHPRHDDVLGLPCFPTLAAAPEVPELAMLLVGHRRVEDAFEEAAACGVRAVLVPGLGGEAGADGPAVAARLTHRARELGVAVLGPNCMGVAVPGGQSAWLGTVPESAAPGGVAIVSQSGSVAEAMLTLGGRIGLRCVVSCGAEAVRDVADLVAHLADDAATRVVALFLETVRRPAAFLAALDRCAARGKPVVCLKVGRSPAAARAALAHTGALVGSERAFAAALRSHGVVQVEDFPEWVELLEVLGRRRRPRGVRLGVVSESGGEGGLVADQAETAGLVVEPLPVDLTDRLQAEFPNFVAPGNPLDAWSIDDPERVFPRALELLAASGHYDILVAQVDLSRFRGDTEHGWCRMVVAALADATDGRDVFPAVTTVHTADPWPDVQDLARARDLALLRGPRNAMRALATAAAWRPVRPAAPPTAHRVAISDLVDGSGALPELESTAILARYGVPVVAARRATSGREAAAAAEELGYPVVVKVDGAAHKSAVGGVVLGLTDADAVRRAADALGGRVLVAHQVAPGVEALCGLHRDASFGPVLAVGAGGTAVERLDAVATSLAPLDAAGARALVDEIPWPSAVRDGAKAVLTTTLVALGRLAVDHPEVLEVDVNPVICSGDDAVAVDALVVVGAGGPTGRA